MVTPNERSVSEIHVAIKGFGEAYAAGDLDRFLGFCTDDIVAMPPGMASIVHLQHRMPTLGTGTGAHLKS